ncbi:DNA-directed RNA polymerase subunit omega [Angustibacter aerolatus]|uniref:DNA-directed RNA polymerase n=1 Tax=Angustibacter aerolatus TaxID=1162965 RepID=A0ABQ6JD22_9ACTN|nr:DNA-directed RNA polymerase subunit omega [Angustibacter aerolatus]
MPGTTPAPEGITNPRSTTCSRSPTPSTPWSSTAPSAPVRSTRTTPRLGEGLLEYVGPLVETHVHEKPLSIALREINEGLLTSEPTEV